MDVITSVINTACVLLVATYLLAHTNLYWDILEKKEHRKSTIYLGLLFGCFSLYASFNDVHIDGAFLSLRNVGPIVGGFIGGPWVGLIAGVISAIERFMLGGFSVWAATLATLLAGLFSGLYARYKKQGDLVGVAEATYFTVFYGLCTSWLVLFISPDFQQAMDVEGKMRLPLILGHAVTVAMYIFITKKSLEERKVHEELRRLDRLHLVGEMASSISHEIRNPMTTVRGYLQYFSGKELLKPYGSQIALMIGELDKANQIITDYLSLAKDKAIHKEMANFTDIVEHICSLLEKDAQLAGKNIALKLQEVPSLLLDEKEIQQLVFNLVLNGLEAMKPGGTVIIHTYVEDSNVVLAIQDEGCGISPDILSKIGIPFITTKDQSAGLGLAKCYHIAERHGAKMDFDTSASGTTFYLLAPY